MTDNWTKCYEDGWKDHIVPEAFSHPAKMSYSLLKRILSHCKDEGWGGVIVDPFGGIGSTGILGAYEGYQVICVELEAKFVALAEQNFKIHDDAWIEFGHPRPVIIQGDSRQLCSVVESADIIVSSPPFQGCDTQCSHNSKIVFKNDREKRIHAGYEKQYHGSSPGQLGSMKPGKVDMVISSPPYAELGVKIKGHGIKGANVEKDKNYGNAEYGQTKGNLGNLKAGDVDVILSSPPYEGGGTSERGTEADTPGKRQDLEGWRNRPKHIRAYGKTEGQMGNDKGDTFWQAAKEIVQQCYQILKPGGHAIWVCKDFVRKGQRVPFSDDWQRLCESAGFKTLHRHKAMLVKEESHKSLFGHDIVKKTERKSFFRRLAEAKGSPKIDWEDVICMVRS